MEFDEFLRQACRSLDLEWRKYRRRASRRRVRERIRELGLSGYESYLSYLAVHPREAELLRLLMRVTVSRFFRDRAVWECLEREVLPRLLRETAGRGREGGILRAWSVGCCGGEEPYTLAMIWKAGPAPLWPRHSLEILATEVDEACLARAREAVYEQSSLREVPSGLRRWFLPEDPGRGRVRPEVRGGGSGPQRYRLRAEVRRPVSLLEHDFETEPPPGGEAPGGEGIEFDLVLCRYLAFTYYRGSRLERAASKLLGALRPGGVLVVGDGEGGRVAGVASSLRSKGAPYDLEQWETAEEIWVRNEANTRGRAGGASGRPRPPRRQA